MEPTITLEITWRGPTAFGEFQCFPKQPGVYAILLRSEDGLRMVRIGATKDPRRRPTNYGPTPFRLEPRLVVAYCEVPPPFHDAMQDLICNQYSDRKVDLEWLEYRMEHKLLQLYCDRFGCLPPANFQRGSNREYAAHIRVRETGALHVLEVPPANLPDEVRLALKQ